MMLAMRYSLIGSFLGLAAALTALGQMPQRVVSPEVHSDRRVTFRLRAPNALKVQLNREGAKPVEMSKDEKGIWALTTEALEPDIYGYSFLVDGVNVVDPSNTRMKTNLLNLSNMVHVKGANLDWEEADVPRGAVHEHPYKSSIVGDHRNFFVYTPPGYDPKGKVKYPALYLQHGFSDDATGWTVVGRAHVIMDNLIAQGKARPMLVVMSLGYGAPDILKGGFRDATLVKRNFDGFRDALLKEVIPRVEKSYRVSTKREDRALAGLSMGGAEALLVGLNHLEHFAWIGAFSAGGAPQKFEDGWPALDAKANGKLKLLWLGCGKDDFLFRANNAFVEELKKREIRHEYVVTEGAHTWMVWRRYLAQFAPKLFQPTS
jgi:enterochelin esterase family protein